MKKITVGLLVAALCACPALAKDRVFGDDIVNNAALAYSTNIDVNTDGIDSLAFTATYSSANIATVTFTDGTPGTGQFTVANSSWGWVGQRIVIGTCMLAEGTDWTSVATASGTAKAIADAMTASACVNSIISSTWTVAGIVYSTATTVGTSTNYALFSSTNYAIAPSGSVMTGGTNTQVSKDTDLIYAPVGGLTKGLAFRFATSAGTAPGGLVTQTTYYALPYDVNYAYLCRTSTDAIASTFINITTTTITGGGSFTLTMVPFTGTPSFKWQYSNDATNFFDYTGSSFTWSASGTTGWDFGDINYRWLRLKYTAGSFGGLNLQVIGNGKKQQ